MHPLDNVIPPASIPSFVSPSDQLSNRLEGVSEKPLNRIKELAQKHVQASESIHSEKEAFDAFIRGDERAVVGYIKSGWEGRVFQRYTYGPIQKSEYTLEAENMFEDLFANFKEAVVSELENGIVLKIKNRQYNLTQILSFVDYDHICLSKEALEKYRTLLLSAEILYKPNFLASGALDTDEDFEKYFKAQGYSEPDDPELRLSLAEKFALNIFTTNAYEIINTVMRNQIDKAIAQNALLSPSLPKAAKLNRTVKEALLHIAVATQGFEKLPPYRPSDTKSKYVWRIEYEDREFPLHLRRRAVEEGGGVEHTLGFFSASHTKPQRDTTRRMVAGVLMKSSQGKNISFFSRFPNEREILFRSSFIQWKCLKEAEETGSQIPLFIGEAVSLPQEYPAFYDFDHMLDFFLTHPRSANRDDISHLSQKTQANLCAYIIETGEKLLEPLVDDFFQSSDVLHAFSSVDSQTRQTLLEFAQEQEKTISNQLLRVHAQCLAQENQATQMIENGTLSNSTYSTITALREYLGLLAKSDKAKLKRFYTREDVEKKILIVKQECEKRFTSISFSFSGQDSLNRELLTSTQWNDALRDPKVILALFAVEAEGNATVQHLLNTLSYAPGRTITSMIVNGVKDQHPVVLETLPLNKPVCATGDLSYLKEYITRKAIQKTFVPIFDAIDQAYTEAVGTLPPRLTQNSPFDVAYSPSRWADYLAIFDSIVEAIGSQDEQTLLSSEAKTSPENLKGQVQDGFSLFCEAEKIDIRKMTLHELTQKMACSHVLLDQSISHLMYDPLHLLTTLRCQDVTIDLLDETISLCKVLRNVFEFFALQKTITVQHAIAAEQLYCRLLLVGQRLSSSSRPVLSKESLIKPSSGAVHRVLDTEQTTTEELKHELKALSLYEEIRSILADDYDFHLLPPDQIAGFGYTELMAYKNRVMSLFKECALCAEGYHNSHFEKQTVNEIIEDPGIAFRFLQWIRSLHLHAISTNYSLSPLEDYEKEIKKVQELLKNPDKAPPIHEIRIPGQLITNKFACQYLRMFSSLEKIRVEFSKTLSSTQDVKKGLRTLIELGLCDKIDAISFKGSEICDLPKELFELRNLRALSFSFCDRLIVISEDIALLRDLQTLTIEGRASVQLPQSIWTLKSLKELNLHGEILSSLPEDISSLQTLQKLSIQSYKLKQIPTSISKLQSLTELHLNCCNLLSVPEEISSLHSLRILSLVEYHGALPKAIGRLKSLTDLTLSSFYLTSIPEEIKSLTNLQKLTIFSSSIERFPDYIWGLTSLVELTLKTYRLASLSEEISSLQALQKLTIESGSLKQLPKSIGKLNQLTDLRLHCPALTSLPEALWSLKNLQKLSIRDGNFAEIPKGMWNFKSLIELEVTGQKIRSIPDEISSLKDLQILSIQCEKLSYITKSLQDITSLVSLTLRCQEISYIPNEFWQMKTLHTLRIETDTTLSARKIRQLKSLKRLSLSCPLTEQIETSGLEYADIFNRSLI